MNAVIHTIFSRMLGVVFGMLTIVLTTRLLGAEGRGTLSLMLASVNILVLINDFAGGSSLANFVPVYRWFKLALPAYIWAIAVNLSGYFILPLADPGIKDLAADVALLSFMLSLITIHYNLLQGRKQIRARNRLQAGMEIAKFFFIAVLFAWHGRELGHVIHGLYLAEGVVLAVSFVLVFRLDDRQIKGNKTLNLSYFTASAVAQLGQVVQFLNYRLSFFIVSTRLGNFELGLYANALVVAEAIWMIGNSLGAVAHMRIVNSESDRFARDITMRYLRLSAVFTAFACLAVAAVPGVFWALLLGEDYRHFNQLLWAMIPAVLALGWSTLISHYLHGKNRFTELLLAIAVALIVQIGLLYMLIGKLGVYAAALSAGTGFVVLFAIVVFFFRRHHPSFMLAELWPGEITIRYVRRTVRSIVRKVKSSRNADFPIDES